MRKFCLLAALISPLACAQVVSVETNSLMRLPNTASTLQLERLEVADYGTLLSPSNVTEVTVGELHLGRDARIAIVPSEQALALKVSRAELAEGSETPLQKPLQLRQAGRLGRPSRELEQGRHARHQHRPPQSQPSQPHPRDQVPTHARHSEVAISPRQEITLKERAAREAFGYLSEFYDDIEGITIARRVMSPDDIAERYHVPFGHVYHVDTCMSRFGPFRPSPAFADYTTPVQGLFLSGASMHPCAGIAGIPGQLAAKTVLRKTR